MNLIWDNVQGFVQTREGVAGALFLVSLLLIVVVSRLSNSIFQEPLGPVVVVPHPSLEAFPHNVVGTRDVLPIALDGRRVPMKFEIIHQDKQGRTAALPAFKQMTVFRQLARTPTSVSGGRRAVEDWLERTGEEVGVIGVSPRTFDHLAVRAERAGLTSVSGGVVVRLRATLPINPIDILFSHPDPGVRATAWLMVLPLWFGLVQQLVLR